MKTKVEQLKEKLQFVMFMQMVAATRNTTQMKRHQALCRDVASLIVDEEPAASKEIVYGK